MQGQESINWIGRARNTSEIVTSPAMNSIILSGAYWSAHLGKLSQVERIQVVFADLDDLLFDLP